MITNRKKERIFSLFLLIAIFFTVDSFGFSVPERLISVSPGITSSLIYFGYGDKIVGISSYDTPGERLEKVENIGSMYTPNVEKIVYLNPDYIIFQSHYDERITSQLEKIGIRVLTLESPNSIEEIIDSFEKILSIFPEDSLKVDARIKLSQLKAEVNRSREVAREIETKPRIFYFLGFGHQIYTAGKETFIDDIITSAGGVNIVEEKGWTYPLEALIVENPDYILTSQINWDLIKKDSRFQRLSAVKNNRIILIDETLITLPTPEAVTEGLEIIQKSILNFNLEK